MLHILSSLMEQQTGLADAMKVPGKVRWENSKQLSQGKTAAYLGAMLFHQAAMTDKHVTDVCSSIWVLRLLQNLYCRCVYTTTVRQAGELVYLCIEWKVPGTFVPEVYNCVVVRH